MGKRGLEWVVEMGWGVVSHGEEGVRMGRRDGVGVVGHGGGESIVGHGDMVGDTGVMRLG